MRNPFKRRKVITQHYTKQDQKKKRKENNILKKCTRDDVLNGQKTKPAMSTFFAPQQ